MLLLSKRAGARGVGVSAVFACSLLPACASSDGSLSSNAGSSNANGGMTTSGSGGTGGGPSANGGLGNGGSPGDSAGAGMGEPTTCTGLQRDDATQLYYMPPDTTTNWSIAGTYQDGQGVLLALHENRSIRLLAIDQSGNPSELINESEYQKNWFFEPEEVAAFVDTDGAVNLLVTDNADAGLIRKQGSTVSLTPLAETNFMDLHVLGFAHTASGVLAMYWKGDRATGTDEVLTAFDPMNGQQTTRTFHGDSGLVSITTATGAWLTAERLDTSVDCTPTGQTLDCGGGETPVPSSHCTWHLDVWNVTDKSFATADPAVTFDIPATISPRCSDSTPLGLATYSSTLGRAPGVGSHHIAALDQKTQGLALGIQRPLSAGMPGVQFELLDRTAKRTIDGTSAPLESLGDATWLAVRAGNLFLCSGDYCAMSTGSAATAFKFSSSQAMTVSVSQAALRPDGMLLIGSINGNPVIQQHVSCAH